MAPKSLWNVGITSTATGSRKARQVTLNRAVKRARFLLTKIPWWKDENKNIEAGDLWDPRFILMPGDLDIFPDPSLMDPIFPSDAIEEYAMTPDEAIQQFRVLRERFTKILDAQVLQVAISLPVPNDTIYPTTYQSAHRQNYDPGLYHSRMSEMIRIIYDLACQMADMLQIELTEMRYWPKELRWAQFLLQAQPWYGSTRTIAYRSFDDEPESNTCGGDAGWFDEYHAVLEETNSFTDFSAFHTDDPSDDPKEGDISDYEPEDYDGGFESSDSQEGYIADYEPEDYDGDFESSDSQDDREGAFSAHITWQDSSYAEDFGNGTSQLDRNHLPLENVDNDHPSSSFEDSGASVLKFHDSSYNDSSDQTRCNDADSEEKHAPQESHLDLNVYGGEYLCNEQTVFRDQREIGMA